MQELPQVPNQDVPDDQPETSSNPATSHGAVSSQGVPEVMSPETGGEHSDQGLAAGGGLSGIPRNSPDSLGDASNLNKVSPNETQQEGSNKSAQPETSLNTPPTSSEPLQEDEQLYLGVGLASNTREVGTQTSGSSQNKTNFCKHVLKKTKKGLTRLTQKTRLGEDCINLVHKKDMKEEVKKSNTIKPSENIESISTLDLLETSNTADGQTLINSYDEVPSGIIILNDIKIGINDNVNIPTSIEPNASVDVGAKLLHKISSNIFVTSSGRLNESTSLDSLEIAVDPNPNIFQKHVGQYLNYGPGQRMGLTIISDSQGGTRFGIPMTEDFANALYSIKAEYSSRNRDSISDRDLSPIHGGVNAINNTIARFIRPKLHNNTEKGKISDGVKITNLAGGLAGNRGNIIPQVNSTGSSKLNSAGRGNKSGLFGRGGVSGSRDPASTPLLTPSANSSRAGGVHVRTPSVSTRQLGFCLSKEKEKQRELIISPATGPYKHVESKNALDFKDRILEILPQNKNKTNDEVKTTIELRNEGQTLYKQKPAAFEECVTNCQSYRDQIEKNDKNFFPSSAKNKTDNNLDLSNIVDLLDQNQISQPKNSVEKAKEESALNAFAIDFIIKPSDKVDISGETSETGIKISNESESESVTGVLTKSEGRDSIGLNTALQIKGLFCKVLDIPETMMYFPHGSSVKSFENWKKHQTTYGPSDEIFAKTLKVPRGLPSIIMAFGDYTAWKALTKLFKIPANRQKFKTDLNKGIDDFYKERGRSPLTKKIVFEFKQAIGRFYIMDTQVDHINMEYTRGGVELFLTGRPRKIIDRSGALIIPTQSNRIRGYQDNSFIDDLTSKSNGLVEHLSSLFTYSLRDDWFIFSLELRSAPLRYSTDTKIKDKIKKLAADLGIKARNIDIQPLEMLKGITNMCNGAIYEASRLYDQNYAKFNLPPRVQVLLMEECIHLHNVRYLLESKKKGCFKNKDSLQKAFRTIILKNITLQKLLGFIYNHEKNKSAGEYGFESRAPLIQSYLQDLIIDPLLQIEGVHDNIFTDDSPTPQETSQKGLQFCEKQQEWLRDLQNLVDTSEGFPLYQSTKNRLDRLR